MAQSYTSLIASINQKIYQNTTGAITGAQLQTAFSEIVASIGRSGGFAGLLTSSNKPSTSTDYKLAYLALGPDSWNLSAVSLGTKTLTQGQIAILWRNSAGTWVWTEITAEILSLISALQTTVGNHTNDISSLQTSQGTQDSNISTLQENQKQIAKGLCMANGIHFNPKSTGIITFSNEPFAMVYNAKTDKLVYKTGQVNVSATTDDIYALPFNADFLNEKIGQDEMSLVVIPANIRSIGSKVFYGMTINEIFFSSPFVPALAADTFSGATITKWYVPSPAVTEYTAKLPSGSTIVQY